MIGSNNASTQSVKGASAASTTRDRNAPHSRKHDLQFINQATGVMNAAKASSNRAGHRECSRSQARESSVKASGSPAKAQLTTSERQLSPTRTSHAKVITDKFEELVSKVDVMRGELSDLTLALAKRPTLNYISGETGPVERPSNPFLAHPSSTKDELMIEELMTKVSLLESQLESVKASQLLQPKAIES